MTWVAWRQFRTQALLTLCLLSGFAALVLVSGLHLRDVYHSLGGARCLARGDCFALENHELVLAELLGPALTALPALLGMFWGAPLLAREYETGTYRLAWTQSVSPRRWLSVRVLLVGLSALAVAGLASWLVSWWFAPLDAVEMHRFDPSVFSARGIVTIGYAGFAFALGVAAGAALRRTSAAMVTTLLGFVFARVAFTFWVRPYLLSARKVPFLIGDGKAVGFISKPSGVSLFAALPPLPNAWAISSVLVDRARHILSAAQSHALLLRFCPKVAAGLPQNPNAGPSKGFEGPEAIFQPCLRALSPHMRLLVSYQPASHYWPLQGLETGIFLLAAIALLAATTWRIGRRVERKPALGKPALVAATLLALPLAGCGSSSPGSTKDSTNSGHPTQAQMQQDAVRFSSCMRSHGVPGFPDPTNPREFKLALAPSSASAQSQPFQAAFAACRRLLPESGHSTQSTPRTQAQIASLVAFAHCIRGHGFNSFPDPTSSGELTHQMLASAGIDVHQPGLEQAADACAGLTHGLITKAIIARFVAGD